MEDKSEMYGEDIFGFGNGTLHIAVMPTPENWEAGRELNVCLDDGDLEAVSLEVFRIARGMPYAGEDNIMKLRNNDRQWFAKIIPEFPMLGRINYLFEDVFFDAGEVEQLRNECLKIKTATTDAAADLGLRKLLYSCDEALKDNFGIELTCD
jgi:hypothetical protein